MSRTENFVYCIRSVILPVFLLIVGATFSSPLQAQSFDYEEYPKLDFKFLELELDLGIQPQNLRIDAEANYQIEANISGADTLTLHASHLDISSVSVDGESVDFSLHNDSLFVPVDDSTETANQYEVNIRYSGRPLFGLLQNSNGTVWTSQLPRSQRHWVPIVDHPRIKMQTTFNISVPSGVQVWATGEKVDEEVLSVDAMRYQFTSKKEVPASNLAFVIGEFENESTSFGAKKINLAIENTLTDTLNSQQLIQQAYDYLETTEDYLGHEFPYQQLQVVVLEDHNWETKFWSGSTIFLYANRGSIESQLLRGVIGQWFGSYQQVSQWSQADATTLYQTLIYQDLTENHETFRLDDQPEGAPSTVYDNFGPERWNNWQKGITEWKNPSLRSFILDSAGDVLSELSAMVSWKDYADFWYRHTGQPIFEKPQFSFESDESSSTSTADSVAYDVYYTLNEADGELRLRFEATEGSFSDLTTLTAYEVYPNKTDTTEVTFTGTDDTVVLQVEPTINTLRLNTSGHPELYLDEFKPSSFLISELRNSETEEQRVKAARKLGYHSDNADLQLAIRDFMKQDLEPEVQAALLGSLADITNGATGTEQTFLDALQSDNRNIREAALMALQNYPDNNSVIDQVQSVARNAEELELFRKATQVLTTITSNEQFGSFVESVAQADTVGQKSVFVIQELANIGRVEEAVEQAELFTENQYRYGIRSTALNILIQHDHASSNWLTRAKELFDEADPRIRYLVVRGLERNKNDEIIEFLRESIQDEYDARVYKKMEQLLE